MSHRSFRDVFCDLWGDDLLHPFSDANKPHINSLRNCHQPSPRLNQKQIPGYPLKTIKSLRTQQHREILCTVLFTRREDSILLTLLREEAGEGGAGPGWAGRGG